MPDRLSLKYSTAAILLAVSFGFSSPAMAGFQWVAPSDAASAPPMGMPQELAAAPVISLPAAAAPQAPVAQAAPEVISPLVISGGQQPTAPSVDNSTVAGFAKSIPLAVAMRQVLPAGYAFSIDQDVDMGTLVSYQGGRPWRDTLRDMLKPAGLVMREDAQMVSIGFGHTKSAKAANANTVYQAGMEPKTLSYAGQAPTPVADAVITPIPEDAIKFEAPKSNDTAVTEVWSAERGQHLRKILEEWSRRANVEFDWLSEYDYPLQASVSFSGGFEGAVRTLLTGFESAHPQPVAELHSNANIGQMVLVVRTRGNTNTD